MAKFDRTVAFYTSDFPRTLFPLDTNKVLIEKCSPALGSYIYGKITHQKTGHKFLPQIKTYAAKTGFHLRRTAKLDPIAEFYLYDLLYRHRGKFKKSHNQNRFNFGYRFKDGMPMSTAKSHRVFKIEVHKALKAYKYCAKFDISCYFNSIYHHDLVNFFRDLANTDADSEMFDKFLKQTNSGRSIDCLPHGIYPAKMLGSYFLNFIDNASWIRSNLTLRFMDDFYFFSNNLGSLTADFIRVQRALGDKGLSVNPVKTRIGDIVHLDFEKKIDAVKARLLNRRRMIITGSGNDSSYEIDENLTDEEIGYLMDLLKEETLEEEDAELVLALMREHTGDVIDFIPQFLTRFPNLTKNIFYFCQYVVDKNALADMVWSYLKKSKQVTEFQLFWLAKLLQEYLLETPRAKDLLGLLFNNASATNISKAKLLEIPDKRFGLSDLREEYLHVGDSGWLSWSSAVGTMIEKKANRNHLLSYFANGSEMNELIATCIKAM
jgi:hypothetical protein